MKEELEVENEKQIEKEQIAAHEDFIKVLRAQAPVWESLEGTMLCYGNPNSNFQDIKDHQPPQSDLAEHEAEAADFNEAFNEEKEDEDDDDELIPSEVAVPPQPGHEEDEYEDGQVDWWDFATDLKSRLS